jgi:tetratricopeptide (TPR) repeat protein
MAAKTKAKIKRSTKPVKRSGSKATSNHKSTVSKVKPNRHVARKAAKGSPKPATKHAGSVESADNSRSHESQSKGAAIQKSRTKDSTSAIHAYEASIKLMHAEEYERAIKGFREIAAQHHDEPEIQERARVLMHAAEKKLQEKSRMVLRSADDHYNMGIAELNRRQLDAAMQHLQHALKLTPKGDHVLYAMAVVNALKGNRDDALSNLKQAVQYRPENRFLAARDNDFETLIEDPEFKQLVTPPEK